MDLHLKYVYTVIVVLESLLSPCMHTVVTVTLVCIFCLVL